MFNLNMFRMNIGGLFSGQKNTPPKRGEAGSILLTSVLDAAAR
jgi:hypothetical protein